MQYYHLEGALKKVKPGNFSWFSLNHFLLAGFKRLNPTLSPAPPPHAQRCISKYI